MDDFSKYFFQTSYNYILIIFVIFVILMYSYFKTNYEILSDPYWDFFRPLKISSKNFTPLKIYSKWFDNLVEKLIGPLLVITYEISDDSSEGTSEIADVTNTCIFGTKVYSVAVEANLVVKHFRQFCSRRLKR